jgi:hypothetical protein
MSSRFHIRFKKSNGNLHVRPEGDFDGTSACELFDFLQEQYDGQGSVLIDTTLLRQVHPFGSSTFKSRMKLGRLPMDRLLFKGKNGFELAPKGTRVLKEPKRDTCGCNGNCAQCKCSLQPTHN